MLSFFEPKRVNSSLKISDYFATYVSEDDANYNLQVTFSILQSDIVNNKLGDLVINVYNQSVVSKDGRKIIVPGQSIASTPKDEGIFGLLNQDAKKKVEAKRKKDSLISSTQIALGSYVNPAVAKEILSGKSTRDISLLYATRDMLVTSQTNQVITEPSSISATELQSKNIELINHFAFDPSEIPSAGKQIYLTKEGFSLATQMKFFYLSKALQSIPKDNVYYVSKNSFKLIDRIYIQIPLSLPKDLSLSNVLEFSFEVYKVGSSIPSTSIQTKKLDLSRYLKTLKSIIKSAPSAFSSDKKLLKVTQNDATATTILVKQKTINSFGDFSNYQTIEESQVSVNNSKSIPISNYKNTIQIYRCSSYNTARPGAALFKNVIINSGIHIDATSLIIKNDTNLKSVKLALSSPPYGASEFKIVKRTLVGGVFTNEVVISEYQSVLNSIVYDSAVLANEIYEYQVYYKTPQGDLKSASKIHRYIDDSNINKALSVNIQNIVINSLEGKPSVSFEINGQQTEGELNRILATIKNQDIYEEFKNEFAKIKDQFDDIVFYKVIRTNLTTGAVEIFNNIGSGLSIIFTDDVQTQKKFNISEIDLNSSYSYDVVANIKNPLILLRDYVKETSVNVGNNKTRTYKYRPYKWLQDSVLFYGAILPEDNNGNLLESPLSEDSTETLVATTTVTGLEKLLAVSNLTATRVDLNKILITWSIGSSASSLDYDHYIVIKEAGLKRQLICTTESQSFVDEFDKNESGTVIYYVIPVFKNYSVGTAARSNSLIVDPEEFSTAAAMVRQAS